MLFIVVLAAAFVSRASAEDWKIIHADGRDYVSLANVAQFYRFPSLSKSGSRLPIDSPTRFSSASTSTPPAAAPAWRATCSPREGVPANVRHARFHVLRDIKIPAVLVEAGFLNDRIEGAHIATPQYRQQLGLAIAQAVTTYNRAVNFQPTGPTIVAASTNLPPHTHSITESLGDGSPARANPPQEPSAVIHSSN